MPADPAHVCLSGYTGRHWRAVKITLLTRMYGPAARCQRFASSCRFAVLHQCIRSLVGAVLLRTIMDISAHAFSLADRPQRAIRVTSVRMRREDRSSISSYSSRRPRLETVDSVTSLLAPHIAQFLCSSQWPFLRPGLQTSIASRAGAVKAGRHAWLAAGSGVGQARP